MKLEINNLTKRYGNVCALNRFSYTFSEGIYGLLGTNGAGKSTLMKLITDTISRNDGEIRFNGTEILKLGKTFRGQIGYMPQQQGIFGKMTPVTFLFYMAELKGMSTKESRREIPGLLELVNLQKEAHYRLEDFSGGMKQRVLLAQALLGNPAVLLLDEPTAGLDPGERIRIRNYIAKLAKNKIVLLSTHIVSDVEKCADVILLMKKGKLVVNGTPESLIASVHGQDLEDVYLAYLNQMETDRYPEGDV